MAKARAAAGGPPRTPLKEMLGKKFETVGELLRDTQQLVADEHVRLDRAGRGEVVDYEERKDFLLVLEDRLFQMAEEDAAGEMKTDPKADGDD